MTSPLASHALEIALYTAAVLGFRHGFDYDHVAAISDLTCVEPRRGRAMQMGLTYVLGHAAMVSVLGAAVICFERGLPRSLDHWSERAVGLTLVLLGIYVLGTMLRDGADFQPCSRAALILSGARWISRRAARLFSAAPSAPLPTRSSGARQILAPAPYSRSSAFLVGIIHGLGAETPSQLGVFLLAANLGGIERGFLGLGMFLAGLLLMNTLMTAAAAGIFGMSAARPRVLRVVTGVTAGYSLIVGVIFLFGSSAILPPLRG